MLPIATLAHSHRLQVRGKVPQEWRLIGEPHAADFVAVAPDLEDDFNQVVNVALRVDAARNGEAHEVHLRGGGEHQRADFDGANAAFEIKFGGEGDAGELVLRNVRQEGARVEVDGVAARRLHDGHAVLCDVIAQIGGGSDAVAEIVFVERFLDADSDGFEIASGKAAVGGDSLPSE